MDVHGRTQDGEAVGMVELTGMAALPAQGRVFTSHRRVRANDADTQRRLRLDGLARYLQDVAFDDLNDAGFGQEHAFWVLRRCMIRVIRPAH
ncbi:MAG: acyl-ACP thioesterase domain-containing protein, partial [Mycobacteriaceae bacterium]